MTEFKVGDRVRVLSGGDGVITYGPVNSTFDTYKLYVVKQDGDEDRAYKVSDLAPKFAVGDRVAYEYGGGGKLVAGPFKSEYHDEPIWVVEQPNGTHMTPTENSLRKVEMREIKVGDRVRIVRATYASRTHGKLGRVTHVGLDWRAEDDDCHPFRVELDDSDSVYVAEVELVDEPAADTYEYDGVVYDLNATYTDRDNEPWTFRRFGSSVRGGCNGHQPSSLTDTLESAVREYGPLTKV
ncbi:phiSA1p31-related protein [Streptomyces sp. NPDC003027]